MSLSDIGGNLFIRHWKNINHVHKDRNYILQIIIILRTDVNVGETVLNGITMNDVEKRAHFIKNSHGRCVVGDFDQKYHEGYILNGHRAVLYFILHKTMFLHSIHHGTKFYDRYIKSNRRTKYVDDDGSGVKPKQKVGNIFFKISWVVWE